MLFLSEPALKLFLQKSRKPNAKLLAKALGLDLDILISPIEANCIGIIESAFQHLNPVSQFFVNGYRIDLYFPQHRLAVECDEHRHSHVPKKQEKSRQDSIAKALGCKFIRFNPHDPSFNLGIESSI
jgi:hypothetical protein